LNRSYSKRITGPHSACPVCRAPSPAHFLRVDERDYLRCRSCEARFLDPDQRPGPTDERAHYLLHENNPGDPRYRKFLSRLVKPLLEKLGPQCRGLDYGCGPGPALAAMLREAGHDMALYDPFFRVMTCFQTDDALFANWHYRKDPTHVVFYREATFEVIAEQRGWACEIPVKDVVLMLKPAEENSQGHDHK